MSVWRGLRRRGQAWSTRWLPYRAAVQANEELPSRLKWRTIYFLGSPVWKVAFACPCGCDDIVELCLMTSVRPHWQASVDGADRVTLNPSVWKKQGCKSHYFIRQGRIIWV
ncbi:DUF6527 family protein [Pseudoxanthomonas koreensis]|uniref:DUF6527 family protein n=1 Tax=Pseudoxanthomonas koreensis TaxID=266061 RepID=UPI003CCC9EE7